MTAYGKRKWSYVAVSVVLGLVILGLVEGHEEANEVEPTRLSDIVPLPVQELFAWPTESKLTGSSRVDDSAAEVMVARTQCNVWLRKVISPPWLPTGDTEFIFIRDEFDDRDVVRTCWQRNGYSLQVSQTGFIFAMKLSPVDQNSLGADKLQRIDKAKDLCLEVFRDSGTRLSDGERGTLIRVPIHGLAQKIAMYSFQSELCLELKGDGSVWGRPKNVFEANVRPTADAMELKQQSDPNNPDWEDTFSAYQYWFRMVHWWNDGNSVGFYFLKAEEDVTPRSYENTSDKNFFRVRSGH